MMCQSKCINIPERRDKDTDVVAWASNQIKNQGLAGTGMVSQDQDLVGLNK